MIDILKGKVVFITGSTRGIGRETAIKCAEHGATLVLQGRNEEALTRLKDELHTKSNAIVHTLVYDVTDLESTKQAFIYIKKHLKQLDVLVNNAGVLDEAVLGMIDHEKMNYSLAVNTVAVIEHIQYAARLMTRTKQGSIINVSSIVGRMGNVGQTVYSASKAAVIGATYSASKELAAHNVRVNAVAPGYIDTDMMKDVNEQKYINYIEKIGMKRIGQPEEVANTILFLASDLSSYVTGQVIGVDGGMVI